MCVVRQTQHIYASTIYVRLYANTAYGSFSQILQDSAIETTTVGLHKLQFGDRSRLVKTENIVNLLTQSVPFTHNVSFVVTRNGHVARCGHLSTNY